MILFVDDEQSARVAAVEFLEGEGYEVCVASDGDEALELFSALDPALVITDLQMPRMDGHELLGQIRRTSPHTPVVVMTADRRIDARRRAEALGADGFVNKPIELGAFLSLVRRFL